MRVGRKTDLRRIKQYEKNARNECGNVTRRTRYVPGHVHQRVERVERVPERVAAVLFGHVRRRRHRLAAVALLHAVLDYVVDKVHGPAHLAEHCVPVLAGLRAVRVPQTRLHKRRRVTDR